MAHASRSHLEHALSDAMVTHPQFVVLTMAGAYPGLSNADITRLSMLTPPTVSVIVGNRKRAGLMSSTRHKTHGRIQQLELTDAGRKKLKSCRRHVQAAEKRLESGLSPDDLDVVRKWLAGVAVKNSDAPE
ncbi:MAG: MarR family transcriptional regulator [Alphaproteobacteria bacterium]|nr:MarR family transcriptional regulator [Alphaproteobacteria bacterium]